MTRKNLVASKLRINFASKLREMSIPNDKNIKSRNQGKEESGKGYWYRYPHAAITADCVIFGFDGRKLKLLLIERRLEPYKGYWALPGGFMKIDESIEETAARELREETNLSGIYLEQFKVYSQPHRDPRERVVTVAFIALVNPDKLNVLAGDDAANANWFDEAMLPPLAFDHRDIIRDAREYLQEILRLKPVAFQLLNKVFTITELQTVYEVINRARYDRRNFLRTAIDSAVIEEVGSSGYDSQGRNTRQYMATNTISTAAKAFHGFSCQSSSVSLEDRQELRSKADRLFLSEGSDIEDAEIIEEKKGRGAVKDSKPVKSPTKGLFDFLRWNTKPLKQNGKTDTTPDDEWF